MQLKKLLRVFIVGNANNYILALKGLKHSLQLVNHIETADIVIFTGGADVNPFLYTNMKHRTTKPNMIRDMREIAAFSVAEALEKPMLGICRGAQLLTVLSGGELIQNVTGHNLPIGTFHPIELNTGTVIKMNTFHHQMMYPFRMDSNDYELVGWSQKKRSSFYEIAKSNKFVVDKEPEIVYYPKTNCLCIQGHPEKMSDMEIEINVIAELIEGYLLNYETVRSKKGEFV